MSEAYQNLSDYAVSTWTLEALPLKQALEEIARYGFGHVELWADTVHLDPRAGVDRKLIAKWLKDNHLKVHSAHGPFRHYENPPEDEAAFRALRMELNKQTLRDLHELQVPIMVVHAVDRNEYNYQKDQHQIVGDFLSELCNYAHQMGVTIALENIPPSAEPVDEIDCTLNNQRRVFAGIGLKYCLDIGHVPLCGADMQAEALVAGSDLVTLHIHNNNGLEDIHNMPNDGTIDWPALYEFLRGMGYKDQFVLEILGGADPIDTLGRTRDLFA